LSRFRLRTTILTPTGFIRFTSEGVGSQCSQQYRITKEFGSETIGNEIGKRKEGRMMTTVIIAIQTRGIAGDGRGEKELWSVHVVYRQKEAGR
jgi:hypothetical protein